MSFESPHRLIRASAGSGKTYRLTGRYLRLLAAGAAPETILATTFTRKAAGEVFGRVLLRLADACVDDASRAELNHALREEVLPGVAFGELSSERCAELLSTLTGSLHRVSISTIDSFFGQLAQVLRFELDLPEAIRLIDDRGALAREIRLQAIDATLTEAAEQDLDTLVAWVRQVHHDVRRDLTGSMETLLAELYESYLEAPQERQWNRLEVPTGLSDDEFNVATEALQALQDAVPTTQKGLPNKTWTSAWQQATDALARHDWQAFLSLGLTQKLINGEDRFSRIEIPAQWAGVFTKLIQAARSEVLGLLAMQTRATHELLKRFHHHHASLLRQHGVLRFADITDLLARELPGRPTFQDVYYRLDAGLHHLLIDEFQDTSLSQWAVIQPIVDEVVAHGSVERTFFAVGDAKQSIYGWRGGRVELFDEVEQRLTQRGLKTERLDVSWRSSPVVLDAVNRVFNVVPGSVLMAESPGARERWADAFEPHRAQHAKRPGHVRVVTTVAKPERQDEDADDDTLAHERIVAQHVRDLLHDHPGRSIGVLVRRNPTAANMLFALKSAGVSASGEGGASLTDHPTVLAVLAALRFADHPGNRVAAFHLFNSPLGACLGLTGVPRGPAADRLARRLRQDLIEQGPASILSTWVDQLAESCDERGLTRLEQLLRAADAAEHESAIDPLRPASLVRHLEAVRVEQAGESEVRVMTVHAAKGLEFDLVVLPELDARLNSRTRVILERDIPTGPVTAVYRAGDKATRALSPQLTQAYEDHTDRARFEDLCVLYVGMTRARYALHLMLRPGEGEKTLAGVVRDGVVTDTDPKQPGSVLYEQGDDDWSRSLAPPVDLDHVEAPTLTPIKLPPGSGRSPLTVAPSAAEGQGQVTAADLLLPRAEGGMRFGDRMHRAFEHVGFLGEPEAVPDKHTLARLTENDPAVIARFHAALKTPEIAGALSRGNATGLWRERAFVLDFDGQRVRGQIDRVVIRCDPDGRVVWARVDDFKTDAVTADELPERVEHYRPQLELYRRAAAALLDIPLEVVTARLLFVSLGRVADL